MMRTDKFRRVPLSAAALLACAAAGEIPLAARWGSFGGAPTAAIPGSNRGSTNPPSRTQGSSNATSQPPGRAFLTQNDVEGVISRVVHEASARHIDTTVAVVDRMGAVLAVWQNGSQFTWVRNNPNGLQFNQQLNGFPIPSAAAAIAKADTAAYLSSSQGNAFSTRTASQIIQDHFNPGTTDASSGPLYGVQFSQLPCSDLMNRYSPATPTNQPGPSRSPLGLSADPGGLPLYKNGVLVGGVGVKAIGPYGLDLNIHVDDNSIDETLALAGTIGLTAPANITANKITVNGLLLRYTDVSTRNFVANPASAPPFATIADKLIPVTGYYDATNGVLSGSTYGTPSSGLVTDTSGMISVKNPPYVLADCANNSCEGRYPIVAGAPGTLTQDETAAILRSAYNVALQTRAQIRNPPGSAAKVTISVVDVNGTILGIITEPDAPNFGIDVSLQKARTATFMSSPSAGPLLAAKSASAHYIEAAWSFFNAPVFSQGEAWSARAIGNISRDTYPDGINGSPNGPFSLPAAETTPFSVGLELSLVLGNLGSHLAYVEHPTVDADTPKVCTALANASGAPPVLANGLQIFPGGFPIYRGNVLVGGIGVSGDGVDQDDMIAFLGLYNAGVSLATGIGNAPVDIRANLLSAYGVSPRYVNCPYAPFLDGSGDNVCDGK